MCFSSTASFVASGLLATVGTVSILKTKNPSFRLFASIPLLFGIQQFTEGFVWLSLNDSGTAAVTNYAVYCFLFFALITWPTFLPLSVLLMEKNKMRKKILLLLSMLGGLISLFMIFVLLFRDISAQAMFLHVHYYIDYPYDLPYVCILIYFLVTAIPQFISSVGKMKWFGFAIVTSFLITNVAFKENVPSVWCFFAAFSSTIICIIVIKVRNTSENETDTISFNSAPSEN